MSAEKQKKKQAEEFVRRVLAKAFNQKLDAETLREVAAKISATIPPSKSKTEQRRPTKEKAA